MSRVYNFSAGPGALPESVLKKAASELFEYGDSGMSVMEMSHRSKAFMDIISETEERLVRLMNIPDSHQVLFLQGGASLQFTMIPMNLMSINRKCDIIHTGAWTQKAIIEAKKFGTVNVPASSEDRVFAYIPPVDSLKPGSATDYVHICYNNTIYGTKYNKLPETGNIPLIADMSSCILSEQYNVSDYGLIFAGAQKNIGPAGLTIVIIQKELMDRAPQDLPSMLDYRIHARSGSMFNTPPTYGIYMAKLIFQWLEDMGGIAEMERTNRHKASLIYSFLDQSAMFKGNVDREYRSLMNVTFKTSSPELDAKFIKEAEKNGLVTLQGHKTAGGMRASIYNAMPVEGVEKLVEFMKHFEAGNS